MPVGPEVLSTNRIKPCDVCGSTEFKSVKALMFLTSVPRGELSIGKDSAIKIPVGSSTIFEKYYKRYPFSYFHKTFSFLFVLYSVVMFVASIQVSKSNVQVQFKIICFGISFGFAIVGIWFNHIHQKRRAEWWQRVDELKNQFVCMRCANEYLLN